MERFPEDSYYLQYMKTILDAYPQHSPPVHPTRLTDQLYIGNQDNADDVTLLTNLDITHVLNCAGTRTFDMTRSPYPPKSGIKGFLMIPAQDYDEFDIMQYFDDAIGFLDSAIINGGKAFVHCSIGVNRSGAIAAAYLMISQKKRLMDVIVELKAKRLLILCNMGFRKQLVQFARANGLLDRVDMTGPKPRLLQPELNVNEQKEKDAETEENKSEIKQNGASSEKTTTIEEGTVEHKKCEDEIKDVPVNDTTNNQRTEHSETFQPYNSHTKKYVYKTRIRAPEVTTPKYTSQITDTTGRNFKNVDSDIVLKLLNQSYNKYKQSSKLKEYKTPSEVQSSLTSMLTVLPHQLKNFAKKSAEKELAREVKDFLTSSKAMTNKTSDVDSLLGGIISKEDEKLIWGKGKLEDDPEYLLFRDNLATTQSSTQSIPQVPTRITNFVPNKTRPLEQLLKKYQEGNEDLKIFQEYAVSPSKTRYVGTSEIPSFKFKEQINQTMDDEVSGQIRSQKPFGFHSNTKDSPVEALQKISSGKSQTNIKPISYYRLQVLNEKKSKDPELLQAATDYLSINGNAGAITRIGFGVSKIPLHPPGYRRSYLDMHI